MRKDTLELLTIVPIDEIRDIGIPFLQHLLEKETIQDDVRLKLQHFWKYFEETWLARYPPLDWNISGFEAIQNRTNNALESYNNKLGKQFPHSHPSRETFVHFIRKDSERNELFKIQVCRGEQVPPKHAGPIKPAEIPISAEYQNYKQMVYNKRAEVQEVHPKIEETESTIVTLENAEKPKKKRGRPPGSKNKPKNV
jgi:hypothetical protein